MAPDCNMGVSKREQESVDQPVGKSPTGEPRVKAMTLRRIVLLAVVWIPLGTTNMSQCVPPVSSSRRSRQTVNRSVASSPCFPRLTAMKRRRRKAGISP